MGFVDDIHLIADAIEMFWQDNRARFPTVTKLVLNQDNGPESNSHRTTLVERMIGFTDSYQVDVALAYYPPYHSKYNAIERCWAALEKTWNGALLTSIDVAAGFASKMTWKGCGVALSIVEDLYEKGRRLTKKVMAELETTRLVRLEGLERWFVQISHRMTS